MSASADSPRGYGSVKPRGPLSWLLTRDHERVAILFFAAIIAMLALGGALGLLLRVELLTPREGLVDEHGYDRLFTAHGLIMIALFLVPAIPTTFGNYLVPLMIGARGLAFPRLNLATLYLYLAGAAAILAGLVRGGVDSGWTIFPPGGESSPESVAIVEGGLAILGLAWLLTALNFIVTIHRRRATSMGWMGLPLFVASLYLWSLVTVAETVVLALGLLVVAGVGRGDPSILLHLRDFAAHAAVYSAILPAVGVVSEIVAAFARRDALSRRALVGAFVAIAVTSLLSWGQQVVAAGSVRGALLFGIPSLVLAIALGACVLVWVGTLHRGSIAMRTPLLYGLAFVFFLLFGVSSGVCLALGALGVPWHGTWFVVAHVHFIMAAGMLVSFLGALHFWFPKITGRTYSEPLALVAAATIILGLCVTFFPEFLVGNAGIPRRSPIYPESLEPLHVIAAAGSCVLAAGLAGALGVLLGALCWGPKAGPNPWGARGLEWSADPQPLPENSMVAATVAGDSRDHSKGR